MIEPNPRSQASPPRTLDPAPRRIAVGCAEGVHPGTRFPALSRMDAIRPGAGGWLAAILLLLAAIHFSHDAGVSPYSANEPSEYASL